MGAVTKREYVLAQLSNNAYLDEAQVRNTGGLPEGWAFFDSENTNVTTGFAANAYFNETTKEIVIAFRGSEMDKSMIDWKKADFALAKDGDVDKLLSGTSLEKYIPNAKEMIAKAPNWDKQFEQGLDFADEIIKKYGAQYKISVTGHSLGGSIAQVVSKMHNLPGVTFDPGGAKNLVESAEFKAWAKEHGKPEHGLGSNNSPTNYIVNRSVVSNYSGAHVGTNYPISGIAHGGWKTNLSANGSLVDTWSRHSMPRILSEFKEAYEQKRPLDIVGQAEPSLPNAQEKGTQFASNSSFPALSTVAQTLQQQCDSNVRGFCEQHGQAWTHGMERTVVLSAAVAREAKMTDIEMFAVKDGNINLGQKDATGFGYITAQVNAREAANTPIEQALERLVAADQKIIEQENLKLQQTQTITQSGPKMV